MGGIAKTILPIQVAIVEFTKKLGESEEGLNNFYNRLERLKTCVDLKNKNKKLLATRDYLETGGQDVPCTEDLNEWRRVTSPNLL